MVTEELQAKLNKALDGSAEIALVTAANIGLRLTMNLAKEVTYTSAMRLNNVTIKV